MSAGDYARTNRKGGLAIDVVGHMSRSMVHSCILNDRWSRDYLAVTQPMVGSKYIELRTRGRDERPVNMIG